MRAWIIFHCDSDKSWIVCRIEGDRAIGVAECPDEETAEAVLKAMQFMDKLKAGIVQVHSHGGKA